ncbi:MAG: TolC family protein [Pirellulaceae bacterium]
MPRFRMPRFAFNLGLICLAGCATQPPLVESAKRLAHPLTAGSTTTQAVGTSTAVVQPEADTTASPTRPSPLANAKSNETAGSTVRMASHSLVAPQEEDVVLAEESYIDETGIRSQVMPDLQTGATSVQAPAVELNLPSALAMVGGDHPVVGFAQSRVREAYAQLERTEVLWLPTLQSGFSFRRHDGNYQASNGDIVDVNLNSFQYGLGAGATGAGTTPQPGLVAQFHLADAIFLPEIAEKTAWARGHAAKAVLNEQLLRAAQAYLELLDAHQDARIIEDSQRRTADISKVTKDFAEAGEGLQADADRVQTELALIDNRLLTAYERIAIASARLAQVISIDASSEILPTDVTAIPLELVVTALDKGALISQGLATRPELKESQALVAAACEAFKREKYAPFVPSVLLGYSVGGFGGGLGNDLSNIDSRHSFDALVTWQVRNLGRGERAARREINARIQQAKYEQLRVLDQVALEISEAFSQVEFRRRQITLAQTAIQTADRSFTATWERIREGEGLPIEVLQAVQALEASHRAYLRAVIDHNQAQFRLQWALGWPVAA